MADIGSYETIDCQLDGEGILLLTLNRPDRLNAFTVLMAGELERFFREANDNDAIRAIIVTGAGRAFCAGMELAGDGNPFGLDNTLRPTVDDLWDRTHDPDIAHHVRDTGGRVTLAIFDCLKPVIAAVNGAAVGIGATMTLAMDFRLASDKARFGFVFGKLGITPEACSTWFLPRLVGLQQALEWVYTAEIFDAEEGLRTRLLRSVHTPDTLVDAARELARRCITGRSPAGTAIARQMMYQGAGQRHPFEAHVTESLGMFYQTVGDGMEGVAAFREKREPQFKDKASNLPPIFPRPRTPHRDG